MSVESGHRAWQRLYLRWLAFAFCATPAFFIGWTLVELQNGPLPDRESIASYSLPGLVAALVVVAFLMRPVENLLRKLHDLLRVQDEHGLSAKTTVDDPLSDAAEEALNARLRKELGRD